VSIPEIACFGDKEFIVVFYCGICVLSCAVIMVSKAFQQGPRSSTLTTSDQRRIDARQWFCTPPRVKLLSFVRGFVQLFVNCGDISGRKSKAGSRRPHLSCPAIPKPSRRSPDGRGIKTPKVPALPIPALLCDSAGALSD